MPTLDARGLACPLPLAMAKRRMADLETGETLTVLATDPEAAIDLAAWAADEGHAFSQRAAGTYDVKKTGGRRASQSVARRPLLPEP